MEKKYWLKVGDQIVVVDEESGRIFALEENSLALVKEYCSNKISLEKLISNLNQIN